ncbi:MAG: hypothetical protein J2P36_20635 [Ktedonobacteraceae bacterium]|nr:hypothetical protein [Ktedonobacteraceae bacterium]
MSDIGGPKDVSPHREGDQSDGTPANHDVNAARRALWADAGSQAGSTDSIRDLGDVYQKMRKEGDSAVLSKGQIAELDKLADKFLEVPSEEAFKDYFNILGRMAREYLDNLNRP